MLPTEITPKRFALEENHQSGKPAYLQDDSNRLAATATSPKATTTRQGHLRKQETRPMPTQPQRMPDLKMDGTSWAMLLILSVLWGGSFFFTEIALVDLPPFTLVLCRVTIASLILWWVVLLRHIPIPRDPKFWGAIVIMGAFNNLVPFSLIVWGQTHIASGLAAILNATTPLFTIVIAHIATDNEKLNLRKALGVLIGFAGVVVIIGLPVGETIAAKGENAFKPASALAPLAPFAILLATFCYGCTGVFGKRFGGMNPILTAAGMTSASSILLIPLAAIIDRPWTLPVPSPETLMAVFGIAALSTSLAYILYFAILKRAGASNLLLVTFLIPVSAILLGVGFLGETLLAQHIIGMGVIGAGLAVIDGRVRKLLPAGTQNNLKK
ncbi:DMT family transporter [Thalassospira povalilytica]|uniref:DMT family transporter n=1 Tax=Thalassospira povalilytica TaxID=732237 RepID=UPI003AA93BF8